MLRAREIEERGYEVRRVQQCGGDRSPVLHARPGDDQRRMDTPLRHEGLEQPKWGGPGLRPGGTVIHRGPFPAQFSGR